MTEIARVNVPGQVLFVSLATEKRKRARDSTTGSEYIRCFANDLKLKNALAVKT